ncbi:MAG: hypothetical protein AAGB48_00690 [Planctomycetota bacterium]
MHVVEFKAELRDADLAHRLCDHIGATAAGVDRHEDTAFRIPSGRLLRRVATPIDAGGDEEPITEYIFYDRPDIVRPRLCHAMVYNEASARTRFGTSDLPARATLRKQRSIYLTGPIRIHLDDVESLGRFIEFVTVVSRAHPVRRCHELVADLRGTFDACLGEAIALSYADLLIPHTGDATIA